MKNEIQATNAMHALEKVLITGDLTALSPQDRVMYYNKVCESIGLNPFTKPFDYITFQGKTILYANKSCTEQLRNINGISVKGITNQLMDGIYIVTANASDKNGKEDVSTGAVSVAGLKGDALANAFMKAETKAKRRVTLSISGLAFLDESEIETLPRANQSAVIHTVTKNITSEPQPDLSSRPLSLYNNWLSKEIDIMPEVLAEWLEAKLALIHTKNELAIMESFLLSNKLKLTAWARLNKDNKNAWMAFHSGLAATRVAFVEDDKFATEEAEKLLAEKSAEEPELDFENAGDGEYQNAIRV